MLQGVFTLEEDPVTLPFQAELSATSYQDLADHLGLVRRKLDRLYPPYGKSTQLSLEFAENETDTGNGL
jgi:hypothetical protein